VWNRAGHSRYDWHLWFGFRGFWIALDILSLDIGERHRKFGGNFR
jgi:hypothetical protein